jgi:phospholipid/cholesterol/gamma-HCH transport system substrate-binding protein
MTRLFAKRRARVAALLAAGSLALSGCGFHGLYGVDLPGGVNLGSHPMTLHVQFADVLDLVPQSNVKVNDVAVGKVTAINLDGWIANVTIEVRGDVSLPANARADVRMTSLLGEKYVDLEQPLDAPQGQLSAGDTIPVARTGTAPELEEVFGALSLLLNGGGLDQIRTITTELNKALRGNEVAVRDLLGQLNTFVGTTNGQKDQIIGALEKINNLAVTLNQHNQTLKTTLDTFPQALQILSGERTKLVGLLSALANLGNVATRVINATQTTLTGSLRSLQPTLERLAAVGDQVPRALMVAGTYPFPIGTSESIIRGDYVNLNLYLHLNLSDSLCGLNTKLCGLIPAAGSSSTPLNTSSASENSFASQLPAMPGSGE